MKQTNYNTNTEEGFTPEQQDAMNAYKKPFVDALNNSDIVQELGLQKAKSSGYICPICGSGSGANGTGAQVTKDRKHITCFANGCFGAHGEDVAGALQKTTGKSQHEILKERFSNYDITEPLKALHEGRTAEPAREPQKEKGNYPLQDIREQTQTTQEAQKADYTSYYKTCAANLEKSPDALAYIAGRGISLETAKKFLVGFDAEADPAQSNHPEPRIIIPSSRNYYMARRIESKHDNFDKMNVKGASPAIFNKKALTENAEVIFITEAAFDALSIIECGFAAVGLNSTSNAEKLTDAVKELKEKGEFNKTFIICTDNDKGGNAAAEKLKEDFNSICINSIDARKIVLNTCKDANEALTADKEKFIKGLKTAVKQALNKRPDNVLDYIDNKLAGEIEEFKKAIGIKTGFEELDEQTHGGLYPGLYCLAAPSSLGKTTFVHQMADQIAEGGTDVIYFSLEMSALELVTKSLTRITAKHDATNAVNSLAIRKGYLPSQVMAAVKEYKEKVGERLSIVEGNFNTTSSFIGEYVKDYIRKNSTPEGAIHPVIIIDYLQIIQPKPEKYHRERRNEIDEILVELKCLSRDTGTTIIFICSVNRANYYLPIDFESLKESGGIEYTCDVVWGLQLSIIGDDDFKKKGVADQRKMAKEEREKNPREIDLVCLKNRYGSTDIDSGFKYYPANDLFVTAEGRTTGRSKKDIPPFDTKRI